MSKLNEAYIAFLSTQLERGNYEKVISRISRKDIKAVYDMILDNACHEPKTDDEFMRRIGLTITDKEDKMSKREQTT